MDSDSDLDLDDPRVRLAIQERANLIIDARLGGASDAYPVTRDQAESWSALPSALRALRRDLLAARSESDAAVKRLDVELRRIESLVTDLAQRKREALYGGPNTRGLKPRVDDIEERVGKPESLSAQAAKVAAFVAAAGGAAAAAVAVAKALG